VLKKGDGDQPSNNAQIDLDEVVISPQQKAAAEL
jgi:hypothetical protein